MGNVFIDRVAKAIDDCDERLLLSYGIRDRDLKAFARAAIKAMREPTVDMEVAGTEAWLCEAAMEDRSKANYRAMIDYALLDGPTTLDLSPDRRSLIPPSPSDTN